MDDFDRIIEESHQACLGIVNRSPDGFKELYSRAQDVTLANPFGPAVRGWEEAEGVLELAASRYRDGEIVGFESFAKHVTPELGWIHEVERYRAKVGAAEELSPIVLRVTSVFRVEDGAWKLIHRHADPIAKPQAAESVIQQ